MTFNEGADLDTSQVTGGGGGVRGGAVIGGGAGGIILLILALIFGPDLTGAAPAPTRSIPARSRPAATPRRRDFSQCKTGADANRDDTCRIIGTVNSVQAYWRDALPADVQRQYQDAKTVIYSGSTQSACGVASNATGPFYCPSDQRVYIDASFFDELTSRFGADGGALAQEYVVAHEYGHHVENLLGILAKGQDGKTGPLSGGVRIELMADCMAGVWANHAATTKDADGDTLLKPITDDDIKSALSAACRRRRRPHPGSRRPAGSTRSRGRTARASRGRSGSSPATRAAPSTSATRSAPTTSDGVRSIGVRPQAPTARDLDRPRAVPGCRRASTRSSSLIRKLTAPGGLRDSDGDAQRHAGRPASGFDFIYQVLGIGFALVPVALALYLLSQTRSRSACRAGSASIARRPRPRPPLGHRALPRSIGLPGLGFYGIGRAARHHGRDHPGARRLSTGGPSRS